MATNISKPAGVGTGRTRRSEWRSAVYFTLHGFGFVGSTLLMTWGLFFLFFLALGGFSFDGLIHQLDNLTSRYVTASPERIASFKHIFVAAHLILAAGLIVLRRHRIMPPALSRGSQDNG